jgi:hypothetical protein
MRRELAAIFIEIGFGVAFLALPYWIPNMPDWMTYCCSGLGIVLILVGFVMFFWKPKKQETLQENGNHHRNSPTTGHDNFGDITYGDKISDSIKDVSNSFNKIETKVYIQDRSGYEIKEIARQISHNINEFEKRFNAIRNGTPKEMSDQYIFAREKLNQIINDDLPKADLVFKEARQIREKILVLQSQYNNYGSSLVSLITEITQKTGVFNKLEIMKGLWGIDGKPPSLNGQINLVIRELVDLLNNEYRNEN